MHTYFINTSSEISSNDYRGLVFEELLASKALIIPSDVYDLQELKSCAEEIALQINQELEIREDIRLVTYLESNVQPSGMPMFDRAAIRAEEILLTIKAEGDLVWTLCQRGKQPLEMIFVLGEKVDRTIQEIDDETFETLLHSACWERVALPSCENLVAWLREHPDAKREEVRENLCLQTARPDAILGREDASYRYVIDSLTDAIMECGENRGKLTEKILKLNLFTILNAYKKNVLRDPLRKNHAKRTCYTYQTLEFRDPQERNRSNCRLMCYVYACACIDKKGNWTEKLISSNTQLPDPPHSGGSPEDAAALPTVDYSGFSSILREMLPRFQNQPDFTTIQAPAELEASLKNNKGNDGKSSDHLITSHYSPPELFAAMQVKGGMTVNALEKAARDTLNELERKNRENNDLIRQYMNQVCEEYDRSKDDLLNAVPFVASDDTILNVSQNEMEEIMIRRIDDLKNTEEDLRRRITAAQQRIVQGNGHFVSMDDMNDTISSARKRIKHDIGCMHWSIQLLIVWTAFILVFAVPYALLRGELFSIPGGYLYLIFGAILFFSIFYIGWRLFVFRYKQRVTQTLNRICKAFNEAQTENAACLKRYDEFLHTAIPQCFGLYRYAELLRSFREQLTLRNKEITYHVLSIEQRTTQIARLLNGLDQHWKETRENSMTDALQIDPDQDRVGNSGSYMIPATALLALLGK